MIHKYVADVPEGLDNVFLVRCPMCDIVYRPITINIKLIENTKFVETMCPIHRGCVYTPMTDETIEILQNAGIDVNSLKVQ